MGIAHTRWATHGRPSNENAHPHTDCDGRFAIVLNGIVENYLSLRAELQAEGHEFTSETDAEVVAHLIERAYQGSLRDAVVEAYRQMEGHFTYCAVAVDEPDVIVGIRKETPLVVGLSEGENFLASAIPAFLAETRSVIFPEDGDVVVDVPDGRRDLRPGRRSRSSARSRPSTGTRRPPRRAATRPSCSRRSTSSPPPWPTPSPSGWVPTGGWSWTGWASLPTPSADIKQVIIVACGTSYHAGLVGKYALERWARMPVEVEVASEFRYRDPVIGPDCLCIAISQSGETADTLAAMRLARQAGAQVLAVTNIVGSQATREADGVLFTRAGLEIGVAATKTFLTQVLAMLLLSLYFADQRGHLSVAQVREYTEGLRHIPALLRDYLEDGAAARVDDVAKKYAASRFFLCLGRNMGLPVALEGALKLKEISYIPTDAYAAGEMKHGPIALLEEGSPVLVVATDSRVYDKLISNVQEVQRAGSAGDSRGLRGQRDPARRWPTRSSTCRGPTRCWRLSSSIVPLQLFAYYVAKHKGEKVDQPRNLAKTVTVE